MARRKNSAEAFEIFRRIAEKEAQARASREAGARHEGSAQAGARHEGSAQNTSESAPRGESARRVSWPVSSFPRRRGREVSGGRKEPLLGRSQRTAEVGGRFRAPPKGRATEAFESPPERRAKPEFAGFETPEGSEASAGPDPAPVSRWLTRSRRTRPRLRRTVAGVGQEPPPARPQRPTSRELLALPSPVAPREPRATPFVAEVTRREEESELTVGVVENAAPPPVRNRLGDEEDFDGIPLRPEVDEVGYGDAPGPGDAGTEPRGEDGPGEEVPARVEDAREEAEGELSIPPGPAPPEDGVDRPVEPPTAVWNSVARWGGRLSQVGGWLLGDGFTQWLRRPVELRLSTLVLSTLVLVITLALIGIYLKKPGPEDRFFRNLYGPGNTASDTDSPADRHPDVETPSGPEVTRAPATVPGFRRPAFSRLREPGPPASAASSPSSLPEFRDIRPLATPEGESEEISESADSAWVRVRSSMDAVECSKLVDFLKERLPLVDQGPDRIGGKRVVPEKRDRHWRVYIGPFRTRSDATRASKHLKELARQNASFVFNDIRGYFDSAYAASGPASS